MGNGKQIKIWRHSWIPKPHSLRPGRSKITRRLNWVHQLIDENSRGWKEDLLQRFFHHFDVEEILKLRIPWRNEEDMIAWHYEKTGTFTVRSAYHLGMTLKELEAGQASSSANPDGTRPAWKKLWKLPVPHKVRIFAWKLIHGGLATKSNKSKRKMALNGTCDLCGSAEVYVGVRRSLNTTL